MLTAFQQAARRRPGHEPVADANRAGEDFRCCRDRLKQRERRRIASSWQAQRDLHPVEGTRLPHRGLLSSGGVRRSHDQVDRLLSRLASLGDFGPLSHAPLEILEVVVHLLKCKPQCEEAFRRIAWKSSRETFATKRSDLGSISSES